MRTRRRATGDVAASSRGRYLRPALLAAVAAVLLIVVGWSWIDAQARAAVVLASVLKAPVATPAVEVLTREPRVEDTTFAGMPTLVARPAGEGPWPALLFVNGTTPEGRTLPEVQNLARGLARAGFFVVVPDLPGLRTDQITTETLSATVEAARATAAHPDARDGRVGLIGASTGATLALLAAEDADLKGRVSVVAGIAPYGDIRTVLNVATTGHYVEGGRIVPYEAEPFLSYAVARSVVAALPPGEDRDTLLAELDRVDRLDPDPLADLRARQLDALSPGARSVVELLANRDPGRFDELYRALPEGVRADLERLSPLAGEGRVEAPVELVSAPDDKYFPVSESYAIARIAPDHRVTVTEALDHAELGFSLRDVPAFLRMDGFVVRSLREARLDPDTRSPASPQSSPSTTPSTTSGALPQR